MNAMQKGMTVEQGELGVVAGAAPATKTRKTKQKARRLTRRQEGVVLEEYAFMLLLVAIGLVAILMLFGRNKTDAEVQQLTSELNGVMGKVKTSYRGQYNKVSMDALMSNGVFKDMTTMTEVGSNVVLQPGGGSLAVAAAQLRTANDSLQWTVPLQPDAACSAIVAAYQVSAGKIVVNGVTIKAVGATVDSSKVTCAGGSNTIELYIA